METEIKQVMQIAKESVDLLRFAFDNEQKKMQIEGISKKYNASGDVINKEPVRLVFRDHKYKKAFNFVMSGNMPDRILNMLLRKHEIDRKLPAGTLCEPLPEGVPPYPNEDDND